MTVVKMENIDMCPHMLTCGPSTQLGGTLYILSTGYRSSVLWPNVEISAGKKKRWTLYAFGVGIRKDADGFRTFSHWRYV